MVADHEVHSAVVSGNSPERCATALSIGWRVSVASGAGGPLRLKPCVSDSG